MRPAHIATSLVTILMPLTILGLSLPAAADEPLSPPAQIQQDTRISPRTTNPTPEDHDGVGEILITYPELSGSSSGKAWRCTTNYIGGDYWMTARHCMLFPSIGIGIGIIRQPDGDRANIREIHFPDTNDVDIAIVKVDPGISATPFAVSAALPSDGQQLLLTGYSGHDDTVHNFPSKSTFIIQGGPFDQNLGASSIPLISPPVSIVVLQAKGVYEAKSVGDGYACIGDSGGGYYSHQDGVSDVLFAVHSGQGTIDSSVQFGCGGLSFVTPTATHIDWIQSVVGPELTLAP